VKLKSIPDETSRRRVFKRRLLAWFRRHGRDLPWRRTRDPYQILVSEVMLQQTQVARVTEYWPRFLARFPTLGQLAEAPASAVHEAWAGLGYYRRAANLHRLAHAVTRDHAGALPRDPAALRTLPGIGPYTAGAVASFAWELPEPAIDTNVHRVLRRVFHPRVRNNAQGTSKLTRLAKSLVPRAGNDAWTTNQALMELGALICTARVMRCESCPVKAVCRTGGSDSKRGTRDA
jgi:A/G-specific adenine glycosylase